MTTHDALRAGMAVDGAMLPKYTRWRMKTLSFPGIRPSARAALATASVPCATGPGRRIRAAAAAPAARRDEELQVMIDFVSEILARGVEAARAVAGEHGRWR